MITARWRGTPPLGRASIISLPANRKKKARSPGPRATAGSRSRLLEKLGRYVRSGNMVHRIAREGRKLRVSAGDTDYIADHVVFAAPSFLASYICEDAPPFPATYTRPGSPRISLSTASRASTVSKPHGITSSTIRRRSVMSWRRTNLCERTLTARSGRFIGRSPRARLQKIAACCSLRTGDTGKKRFSATSNARTPTSANVFRASTFCAWATPWRGRCQDSSDRNSGAGSQESSGNLLFANSDLSGFSIFEEAQYRGVKAADRALQRDLIIAALPVPPSPWVSPARILSGEAFARKVSKHVRARARSPAIL